MRKRLAIFAPGGIAIGAFSQGLPTIERIVDRLSEELDLTFYSLFATDRNFKPTRYTIRSPPAWLAARPLRWLRWLVLLAWFLRDHGRHRFDTLAALWAHPVGTFVVALARLLGRPSIVFVLGGEIACLPEIDYGSLRHPLARRLVLRTCARASALILISNHQRAVLRDLGLERAEADVHVIPWGADPALFTFQAKQRTPPLKIVHVANLTEVKDQRTLVRAFALVRSRIDAKLRFVGPDFMHGQIQALVRELGLGQDVDFVGAVPFADIALHYRWADMFVLTSLSEGQNGAVTEAVACGVLAVGTPFGLVSDLGEAAAVLVAPGDPEDVAAKIVAIAGDPAAWAAKLAGARAWTAIHDFDWTIRQLSAVVRKLG